MPGKSLDKYRFDVDQLFGQYIEDHPVVVGAIDFSRCFDIAEPCCEHNCYLESTAIYQGLFEEIDTYFHLVDVAYDHYTLTFHPILESHGDCMYIPVR